MTVYWDGKESLSFVEDDGGRAAAGYTGSCRDCVVRAVAIAAEIPYDKVYQCLASGMGSQRKSRGRSARNGISVSRKWFKDYMLSLGFKWVPTMGVGTGCKVHLLKGELPMGRIIVSLSKHYTAVIDGVVHDIVDPTRATLVCDVSGQRLSHRCVYGYWTRDSIERRII